MQLGIISEDFLKETFVAIKARGLDFVEFCVNALDPDRYLEFSSSTNEIKTDLSSLGLFTGSVGRWGGTKLLSGGKHNEAEFLADEALIKAAAALSCHCYVTGCNYVDGLSLFENYKAAISYFERLLEIGKQNNVEIATYNCRWQNFIASDPAWSVVHGQLPDLKIKFDPSHCIYAGGDYLSEIKKWGNRFTHVHIKGSLVIDGERFDDPPAGLDQTNWGAFMATLYASSYDGTLSIEPHSAIWKGELGDKGIDYTIKTIRGMML